MATQTIKGGFWLPRLPSAGGNAPSYTTTTLLIDAAGEKAAFVVRAPKTGNIRKIVWRTGTVTTGDTVDVRLETVSLTNGDPTGTLFGTNTNASQVVADANDNVMFLTQLTADAAVVQGDLLAAVIVNGAAPGNMQIVAYADEAFYMPYVDLFTASWGKNFAAPVLAFEYDDGSFEYMDGCLPYENINTSVPTTATTPDIRALRFRVPFPTRVRGAWFLGDFDDDTRVILFDSDGITVLTEVTPDANVRAVTNVGLHIFTFPASPTLLANTYYRLAFEPQSTTGITMYDFSVPSTNSDAMMDAFEGGKDFHYSAAKNPVNEASWTNQVNKRIFCGLRLDQMSDGAGGTQLFRPDYNGGYNG